MLRATRGLVFLALTVFLPRAACAHHQCGEAVKAYNAYVGALVDIRALVLKSASPTAINNPNLVSDAQDRLQQVRMRCTASEFAYTQAYALLPIGILRETMPHVNMTSCMENNAGLLLHPRPRYVGACPKED